MGQSLQGRISCWFQPFARSEFGLESLEVFDIADFFHDPLSRVITFFRIRVTVFYIRHRDTMIREQQGINRRLLELGFDFIGVVIDIIFFLIEGMNKV